MLFLRGEMGGGKRGRSVPFPEALQKGCLKALSIEPSLKISSLPILLQLLGRFAVPAASSLSPLSPEHPLPSTTPVTLLSAPVKSKGSVSVPNLTSWLHLTVLSTLSFKKNDGAVIFKLGGILSLHGILQAYKKE